MNKKISLGILAHVDAGKTTLTESMLYKAGSIKKIGRVDNKDSFLDHYDIERKRGITVFSKQARLQYKNLEMILLDTPGHMDFGAEMERSLAVLDYAILVVSAANGVQSHTRTLWELLKSYQIPTYIYVNKLDQLGTDKEKVIKEIQKTLDTGIIDFTTLNQEEFYDNLAMCSEELLEEYLENSKIALSSIQNGIQNRDIFPCYTGSALKQIGVEELLDGLEKYTLGYIGENDKNSYAFWVYKITRDMEGLRLTHIRIVSGKLVPKQMVGDEKINQIRLYNGVRYELANEIHAGEIAVLTGLQKTYAGERIVDGQIEPDISKTYLEPVLNYELYALDGTESYILMPKLLQIAEEFPEIAIVWEEKTGRIQAKLMGTVQIEILKNIILERIGIEVGFSEGSIIYKESISNIFIGMGHFEPLRHYAEVHLMFEPLPLGSGLEYIVNLSSEQLAKNYQSQILETLKQQKYRGALLGMPLIDIRITLLTGLGHIKHTVGGDFREATIRAIRHALLQARQQGEILLLEPYYDFRLWIPATNLGRALNDLNVMYAKFEPPSMEDGFAMITGKAPVSKMQNYQVQVSAYTKGLGQLSLALDKYMPCHNSNEVLEQIEYDPESDIENPAYSIFCSHGEGYSVSWKEIGKYIHISNDYLKEEIEEIEIEKEEIKAISSNYETDKADSEELMRIFERTYGKIKTRIGDWDKPIAKPRVEKPYVYKEKKAMEEYILVDGYNVIFAWRELSELAKQDIYAARQKLADILSDYQAYSGVTIILVFDAYRVLGHQTEIQKFHNIYIVYTKEAETADQYIEKTVHTLGKKYRVRVITSDGVEQIIIHTQGCLLMSSMEFLEEIKRMKKERREIQENKKLESQSRNYLLEHLSKEEIEKLRKEIRKKDIS